MSQPRFMDERQVYSNYAQAMAWTLFFMHHDQASYRDALPRLRGRDCYRGRFRPRCKRPQAPRSPGTRSRHARRTS